MNIYEQNKRQFEPIARQEAQKAGIDENIFVRLIDRESAFDPNAKGPEGEIGIAQFRPNTAAVFGVNPQDPRSSLNGAARYLTYLLQKFDWKYSRAIAAYRYGEQNVQSAINRSGPNWREAFSNDDYIDPIVKGHS